ncbi:hypothetical protein E2C01_049872 [Portunus trituberculatus]|uniref:Uncharacterized protein n=1 Tax=Portunus trituberculatus TaxID=210409 RepID=A0A5B7GE95_PORTR|nr:hypothetical protein [Portunus trituberculatus]
MAWTTVRHEEAHDCNEIVKKGENVGPTGYWLVRKRKKRKRKRVCVDETRWARRGATSQSTSRCLHLHHPTTITRTALCAKIL